MNTRVVIACLAVLVGLAAGFYGGYSFGQAHAASSSGTGRAALAGAASGTGGAFAGLGGAGCPSPRPSSSRAVRNANRGVASGTVTLLTQSGFTVDNTRCNTQVKVTFGPSVTVVKTVTGSTSDLANNQTVTVIGTRQSDGTIQATTIAITPAGSGGFGGFGGFGRGNGSSSTPG